MTDQAIIIQSKLNILTYTNSIVLPSTFIFLWRSLDEAIKYVQQYNAKLFSYLFLFDIWILPEVISCKPNAALFLSGLSSAEPDVRAEDEQWMCHVAV